MARIEAILQQRTLGQYGHFLNHRQSLSHCGGFLYYDTRNADPDISKTSRIESLELETNTVRVVYDTQSQSIHGPGVGAVVCHPHRPTIAFIHGLSDCDSSKPYSMTRRFGAWANIDPLNPVTNVASLESRSIGPRLPWGTLGGGTHAHSFSRDGNWVSFTYNDALLPQKRAVGFTLVDRWQNEPDFLEVVGRQEFNDQFRGLGWSALAILPEEPIESAREECWIETANGESPTQALAMIVRLPSNSASHPWVDEIYVAKFPRYASEWPSRLGQTFQHDINACIEEESRNPSAWRLRVPEGIEVRRLTRTFLKRHPGIQGPRHWLLGSNSGQWIYSMMRDENGVIRLVRVSVLDGSYDWISENQESITHPVAVDQQSRRLAYLVNKSLTILDLQSGHEHQVQWDSSAFDQIVGPVQFLKDSAGIFFSAFPRGSESLQIWTAVLQ